MIKYFKILLLVVLFCSTAVNTKAQISILVNKASFASVEEAANGEEKVIWSDADLTDDRACTESFAATELSHFLALSTGITDSEIQFSSTDNLPAKGDVFLLGSERSNPLVSKYPIPQTLYPEVELQSDQSFHIRAFQENNRTITIIEGKERVGTLYGVYAYLEQLGIRFYGLGEKGTVYPDKQSILPKTLDITGNPSFLSRGFISLGDRGDNEIYYWMARNRMNACDETGKEIAFRKKLGMLLAKGGHGFQRDFLNSKADYPYNCIKFIGDESKPKDPYTPSDEYAGDSNGDGKLSYFEAHPEWFGLRNGKRSDRDYITGSGDNYNTSNKDATKELAKNLVQSLINGSWKNVDVVNFWMLDNGKWCECDNCKRQGSITDRLFDVSYTILKEIKDAREHGRLNRRIQLATLAYHETLPPPDRPLPKDFDYDNFTVTFFPIERCYVHSLADPACTEINQPLFRDYQQWTTGSGRNYKGSITIGEYYNVSSFMSLPVLFPTIMATDIPWYNQTGSRQFGYMHTPANLWGTWTLNQYLLGRLMWDSKTNSDSLLNEYFHRYYPTTFEHTKKFYKYLEEATSNMKPFIHYAGKERYRLKRQFMKDSMKIFTIDHLQYDSHPSVLNTGPSVVEMVNTMHLARTEIDASLMQCKNKVEYSRLIEDDRRFEYGEEMVLFYYHLLRTVLFHRDSNEVMAKHEFGYVEKMAGQLRNITDIVGPIANHPGGGSTSKNGLEATTAVDIYDFYKKKYGN